MDGKLYKISWLIMLHFQKNRLNQIFWASLKQLATNKKSIEEELIGFGIDSFVEIDS